MPSLLSTKKRFWVMLSLMAVLLPGQVCMAREPDAQQLIGAATARFQSLDDYTCRLDKRVRKGGRLYEDLGIAVKYKKSKHYYFRWTTGIQKGREVIYVEGKHDDKLVAHPGGPLKFLTIHLDAEGALAMQRNRHSLKFSGMEKMIALIESNYRSAVERGMGDIHVAGREMMDGKPVWVVDATFPEGEGFYARRIRIAFCAALDLPVKISIYDWHSLLSEEYVFRHLTLDVGLTEGDFDPRNPAYHFQGS